MNRYFIFEESIGNRSIEQPYLNQKEKELWLR